MDDLCKLILELYRAAQETPVAEFHELALSMIRAKVFFRTAMWGDCEMTGDGLRINSVHLHNEPQSVLHDWAALHRHDPMVDLVFANPGRAVTCYTPETYRDATEMLDFLERYGHANSMVVGDFGRKNRQHLRGQWVSLYRADKHAHFGEVDRHILEHLMPHLVEALEINRRLGAGQLAHESAGLAGTRALVRKDGTLYHCGTKFAGLLREIWPEMKSGWLPTEFMAMLVPGKETLLAGHDLAVSATGLGDMLLLGIRRISPLDKLARRELEVARLFGEGKSYKEIGLLLGISPATVRNFLGRVYTKLDINNKVELASLLAENTNLP